MEPRELKTLRGYEFAWDMKSQELGTNVPAHWVFFFNVHVHCFVFFYFPNVPAHWGLVTQCACTLVCIFSMWKPIGALFFFFPNVPSHWGLFFNVPSHCVSGCVVAALLLSLHKCCQLGCLFGALSILEGTHLHTKRCAQLESTVPESKLYPKTQHRKHTETYPLALCPAHNDRAQ